MIKIYLITQNYKALKKSTFKYLVLLLFSVFTLGTVSAQEKLSAQSPSANIKRCYTMEALDEMIKKDPSLPEKWRIEGERLQRVYAESQRGNGPNTPTNVTTVTVVPIVFHIVGTAANQSFVTDEQIQRQVDVLNRDFAGKNPDSVKLPPAFKALFGHSEIQFSLAKRTPTNTSTNGIERRVTTATFTSGTVSNLKHTATGGLDAWDGNKYFNVWIGNFTDGLLGIATFPWMTPADEQGVAIHYGSIDQPCGSPFAGAFDGGRTLVHETGHYFYLFHIWGDDGGACTGNDFRLQAGFNLPANCTDDTPNQGNATSGCLSGVVTDACAATAPGIMYQNYMDYTDDACYGLFTISQNCRAQACLDLYRASLKTSNGCVPVSAVNNDVRVSEILNPLSRGFACGTTSSYCGTTLTPQVLIVNDGDAPLTSLTFNIKIDGVTVATQNWTGNLAPAAYEYANLTAFTTPSGAHVLTVKTSNPNGASDGRPNSDSARANYSALGTISLPQAVDFEPAAAAFPPVNWSVINPDGARTWAKRTSVIGPNGISTSCMWIDAANYGTTGAIDIFRSNNIDLAGVDSVKLSWNLSKTYWPGFTTDSLQIVYSEDCGLTWKNAGYNRGGTTFITAPAQSSDFTPNSASQWISESISLSTCNITAPTIMLGFRFRNGFGNNIFVDNINVTKVIRYQRNASVLAINQPLGTVCGTSIVPAVRLGNSGSDPLTAVTFNYQIDNGTPATLNWTGNLSKCNSVNVTLTSLTTTAGTHVLTVYTTNPNGAADQFTGNDTLRKTFIVSASVNLPIVEGFENSSFPPVNWTVQNPDGLTTWTRSTAAARTGIGALLINNPAFSNGTNTIDQLYTPVLLNSTNYDSVFISWDHSYIAGNRFPGSTTFPLDTLEVLITTDCGASFKSIWKKWGEELQTINDPNFANIPAFTPTQQAEWKNTRIYLNPYIGTANFQVYFVAKSNKQNNLWLDNINISSKTLPARLKSQGYLVYPNPFNNSFRVHHWIAPADLQGLKVYNSIGELVWEKRYNGNAGTEINIDLSQLAAGVYVLKLNYATKTIVERIIKQ